MWKLCGHDAKAGDAGVMVVAAAEVFDHSVLQESLKNVPKFL